MDYKDVIENAEKILKEGLSAINDYPNDDVEMELLELEQSTLDAKLQVVREALLAFARGFSTSRPLLLQMHDLYSSAIKVRNARLEEYIELTKAVLNIKHVKMDPMAYFQRKSKEKWKKLVQEKTDLLFTVGLLKNTLEDMQSQISKMKSELENSKNQIKIEYQSRLSALVEMKQIQVRMHHQIKKRSDISSQDQGEGISSIHNLSMNNGNCSKEVTFPKPSKDPIFLEKEIITLQKAYSDLFLEMCAFKVMYSDSVPLKRFEALEELVNTLKKKRNELQETIESLREDNEKLQEEHKKSQEEYNKSLKRIDELENGSSVLATHWNRCAEYLPGGIERWKKITKGKNNAEMLEILVDEIEIMSVASKYYEDNVLFS